MSKLSPSNRTADCFSDRGECCFCLPIGARHRSTTPPDAKLSGSLDGGVTNELFQIPERANYRVGRSLVSDTVICFSLASCSPSNVVSRLFRDEGVIRTVGSTKRGSVRSAERFLSSSWRVCAPVPAAAKSALARTPFQRWQVSPLRSPRTSCENTSRNRSAGPS